MDEAVFLQSYQCALCFSTEINSCMLWCGELWNSFIVSFSLSSEDRMLVLSFNMFWLNFPFPEYPKLLAMFRCRSGNLHSKVNLYGFSFMIALSITNCEVTLIIQPYSLCYTLFIVEDFVLPKAWEHSLFLRLSFSVLIFCCCCADHNFLILLEVSVYLSCKYITLLSVIFLLIWSIE